MLETRSMRPKTRLKIRLLRIRCSKRMSLLIKAMNCNKKKSDYKVSKKMLKMKRCKTETKLVLTSKV